MSISEQKEKLQLSDFQIIKCIGEGAFGEVFLVKSLIDNKNYALKQIDKNFITKHQKQHHIYLEKIILWTIKSPYVVKLFSTFQDQTSLYFVLDYLPYGELSNLIQSKS